MVDMNRQVIFTHRPTGAPSSDVFHLQQNSCPQPGAGEYLLRNHYIAMDPALVSRMRAESNYAESVTPGEVMHAYAVGEVIESCCDEIPVGQMRFGRFDMQEYAIANKDDFGFPIDTSITPASWYLGVIGTTGTTAYLAIEDICNPEPGETIVISSAGSSVGTIAAQLASQMRCQVVGITSTDEKAAKVKKDWPYNAVVSYRNKTVEQLSNEISAACPDGIDIYFDNTSGDISEALLDHYNIGARIAVIGRMGLSHLSNTRDDVGRRDNNVILSKRIRKQGFVLSDHPRRMIETMGLLADRCRSGELKVEEDILKGIENASTAFFRMLRGDNQGKQLVQLVNN